MGTISCGIHSPDFSMGGMTFSKNPMIHGNVIFVLSIPIFYTGPGAYDIYLLRIKNLDGFTIASLGLYAETTRARGIELAAI